jgi:hypothetical protein
MISKNHNLEKNLRKTKKFEETSSDFLTSFTVERHRSALCVWAFLLEYRLCIRRRRNRMRNIDFEYMNGSDDRVRCCMGDRESGSRYHSNAAAVAAAGKEGYGGSLNLGELHNNH